MESKAEEKSENAFDFLNVRYTVTEKESARLLSKSKENGKGRNSEPRSLSRAKETVAILEALINRNMKNDRCKNAKELLAAVTKEGRALVEKTPGESSVLSTVLRVLLLIRESVRLEKGIADFEENLTNVLFAHGRMEYDDMPVERIRDQIDMGLNELSTELESCVENIATQSVQHIHSNEIIFTLGYSKYVFEFLQYAAKKKRKFQVILAEGYPDNGGHVMATELAMANIEVILVPDSHAFALMSRVNKVIVGSHTVFTDGGLRARVGTHGIMLAAKRFEVPIYVCLPQYKISPKFFKPNEQEWLGDPTQILPDSAVPPHTHTCSSGSLEVVSPKWDYIPQGLVTLFITNVGGNAPSYLYAVVRESFHKDDIQEALTWG